MPRYPAAIFLTCLLWLTAARAEDVYVTVPWKEQQTQIRARLVHPAGSGPFPGVILMHHCGGLNADSPIPFYTPMLVQQGCAVAVPAALPRATSWRTATWARSHSSTARAMLSRSPS